LSVASYDVILKAAANVGQCSPFDRGIPTPLDSHQKATEPTHNSRTFYRTTPCSTGLLKQRNRSSLKSLTKVTIPCSDNTSTSTPADNGS